MASHRRHSRKEFPHDEASRVPMIVRWPGAVPARGVVDGLFSLVDLAPTTLGLAGVPVPDYHQGHDWSSFLRGAADAADPPREVLLEMCLGPRYSLDFLDWRGVRTAEHLYAFYETGHEQLYDLRADPYQLHNLAGLADHETLRQRLLRLLAETGEPVFHVLMEHCVAPETSRPTLDASDRRDTQNHPELVPPADPRLPLVTLESQGTHHAQHRTHFRPDGRLRLRQCFRRGPNAASATRLGRRSTPACWPTTRRWPRCR